MYAAYVFVATVTPEMEAGRSLLGPNLALLQTSALTEGYFPGSTSDATRVSTFVHQQLGACLM